MHKIVESLLYSNVWLKTCYSSVGSIVRNIMKIWPLVLYLRETTQILVSYLTLQKCTYECQQLLEAEKIRFCWIIQKKFFCLWVHRVGQFLMDPLVMSQTNVVRTCIMLRWIRQPKEEITGKHCKYVSQYNYSNTRTPTTKYCFLKRCDFYYKKRKWTTENRFSQQPFS